LPHLAKAAKIIANQNKHYDFDQEASASSYSETDVPFGVQVLHVAKDFEDFVSSGIKPADALNRIRDKEKHYNQSIVEALSSLVSGKPTEEIRFLKIKELSVGMIFMENITTTSGQILCPKGTEVHKFLLERLINFSHTMNFREPIKVIVPST
ncbi:MAG: hypothetical protein QGG87_04320, partial [Nitrospinota bacterium]|nr:hypothetical protein [Nitrospinota bacterium]